MQTSLRSQLRPLLRRVKQPAWYVGGEVNQVRKDPASLSAHMALIYPDCYEIGMSHYGLKILYEIINAEADLAAERCFLPWPDFGDLLREREIPLYGLESGTPLDQFDVLGFTIQSELTLTNVLGVLELGHIPVRARDRRDDHPFVVAGGAGAYGPEPLAEVVDLFVLGDGEETVVPILRELAGRRRAGDSREQALLQVAKRFPCVYAPRFYHEQRDPDGTYRGVIPSVEGLPERIRSAYVFDLETAPFPVQPVVPHTKVIHDRIALEVMRGCVHSCRFCQAGMLTRPWRVRSAERLVDLAKQNHRNTGMEEISLLSLSTSDYPYLEQVVGGLKETFAGCGVNVSLPSLRVNEELQVVPGIDGTARKGGLTLAPEVATDRLRRKVNKPIKNEDLYAGVRQAYASGFRHIKLYFMIGVPGEEPSDLDGILEMAETCSRIGGEVLGHAAKVVASCSTFIPKPFTPYQWDGMLDQDEVRSRQQYLRSKRRMKSVELKFHDSFGSFLEGVLSRGDRRVGEAVIRAHELGCSFDGWTEMLRPTEWAQAFAETGVDPQHMAQRQIPYDEGLPWDHLDAGPSREFLQEESEKARAEETTHHCFGNTCNQCGVDLKDCFDLKRAMPDPADA